MLLVAILHFKGNLSWDFQYTRCCYTILKCSCIRLLHLHWTKWRSIAVPIGGASACITVHSPNSDSVGRSRGSLGSTEYARPLQMARPEQRGNWIIPTERVRILLTMHECEIGSCFSFSRGIGIPAAWNLRGVGAGGKEKRNMADVRSRRKRIM